MLKFLSKLLKKNKQQANTPLSAQATPAPDIIKGIQSIPTQSIQKDNTPPINVPQNVSLNPPIKPQNNIPVSPTSSTKITNNNPGKRDIVDEQRILGLLKQAEMAKNFAWEKAKKTQQHHTKIPVYTGNPFSVGDCENCEDNNPIKINQV